MKSKKFFNLPFLSIIIPSYNQGSFIEETLLSVIKQDYPDKELIVIDGGSTDNSVEIIKKYEKHIAYWVSEKDNGQSDAINKGFRRAKGNYIAWMNSDDIYYEGALSKIFSEKDISKYDFIYGPACSGEQSLNAVCINSKKTKTFSLFNLLHFFYSMDYIIPSQSVFIKRDFIIRNNIGYLNKDLHYCMDLDWYCRIALHQPAYYRYNKALSFFRINNFTKSGSQKKKVKAEAIRVFYTYRKYLHKKEEKQLTNLLLLEKFLIHAYEKNRFSGCKLLLRILTTIPKQALRDKRFLGLCKNYSFNKTLLGFEEVN